MKKRVRIISKTRFVLFLIVLCLSLYLVSGAIMGLGKAYGSNNIEHTEIHIKQGDTLWAIARNTNNSSDIRKMVDKIMELNNMEDGHIIPGQLIKVPVF